jgi:hypothetical protein
MEIKYLEINTRLKKKTKKKCTGSGMKSPVPGFGSATLLAKFKSCNNSVCLFTGFCDLATLI